MVVSHETIEQIVKVLLKYVSKTTAHRMTRDLYCHVTGSKSVTETFRRIAEQLELEGDYE